MATMEIRLFGVPEVLLDGRAAAFDTRKALALLAYLVESPGPRSRDTLAGLLWPDAPQERARASLRRTLSVLGKELDGRLTADRSSVRFDPDGVDVDVLRFHELVRAARAADGPSVVPLLEEAAALYRDDFLAGVGVRDSAEFEDWQRYVADGLRGELAVVLERLTEHLAAAGRLEDAVETARRWLGLDLLHEPAHRWLLRLHAWTGQRAAAVRQYRECVRILDEELGVAPLEETTALYEQVCEDLLAAPPTRVDPAPGEPPTRDPADMPAPDRPPLVGREDELAALVAGWRRAAPDGRLLVVAAPAGMGKSRLVEELADHVAATGGRVLVTHAHEGERSLPYGPLGDALRAAAADEEAGERLAGVADHWLAEAARLTPQLADLRPGLPVATDGGDPAARARFFEALGQVLGALLAGEAPGLLVCEDLQWADAATLELLAYLAHRLAGRPLALLVTWRSDELDGTDPLPAPLEAEASAATRVSLAPLGAEEVAELADALGGGAPEGDRLHVETAGVPFFVVQYLSALQEVSEEDGTSAWPLPEGIRALVGRRLGNLGEEARQLASAAAVIGRPFDADLLRAVSGRSEDEVVTGLEELLQRGLVRPADDATFDLAHDAVRRVALESTSQLRVRLLHRRVAEALPGVGEPEPATAARVATHLEAAGQTAAAAGAHVLAGRHAAATFAHAEALRSFRAALALGHPEAAVLHEAIGGVLTLQGRYREALAAFEAAASVAETDARARLEHQLGQVRHRRGDWSLAEGHFATAVEALDAGAPAAGEGDVLARRAGVLADWAMTAHRGGRPEEAAALAARSMADAEAAGDASALAQAHNTLGVLAKRRGELDVACEHLRHSLALAEELGRGPAHVAAMNNLALAQAEAGATEEATALVRAALRECSRLGDRHREAALLSNLADLLHAAGEQEEAMAHLKRAVAIFADIGGEPRRGEAEIWKLTEW
jgi:DNA-binding SARP family transcriptional activator/predicted ATPase